MEELQKIEGIVWKGNRTMLNPGGWTYSTCMYYKIHAFVSSKLDYCNSNLYGLPDKEISKIQRVQNSAARLDTKTRRADYIMPILRKLHLLPVRKRFI